MLFAYKITVFEVQELRPESFVFGSHDP